MKQRSLFITIGTKVIIVLSLVLAILFAASGLNTLIEMNLALNQLENSDANFMLLNTWNKIKDWLPFTACRLVILIGTGSIAFDIWNYFRKD